ncbi:MAG: pseudouridine-5'-phosphate glycosidase [Rhodospirillaceae bacterium]
MKGALRGALSVHPEVADALAEGRPVVALESTLIAHGLPRAIGVETARGIEQVVRDGGAVPATIAVLDGRIRVGLGLDDLERLTAEPAIAKLSRRDLAVALALGGDGATTVAATMMCAAMAGIRIFATGGIGGVHRGAESSFDISADLEELAQTRVAVVCAGAKVILDLPKTLEYLETRGVPVLGFGTDGFPAFYCRDSGLPVSYRCDDADAVSRVLRVHWALDHAGGVLVAVPIPEHDALSAAEVEAELGLAFAAAASRGIVGQALTPFLLERLHVSSGGRTLAANIALVRNNAGIAAAIAVAWQKGASAIAVNGRAGRYR